MKIRLLVTKNCPKNCSGCCNKDWDLDGLPVYNIGQNADEILITGGEPLLYLDKLYKLIGEIHRYSLQPPKIYIYTATNSLRTLRKIVPFVRGITLTLHEQVDADILFEDGGKKLYDMLRWYRQCTSFRLNIFDGIKCNIKPEYNIWDIKQNIKWIENCPLPKNEIFMRLENLW